MRGERRRGSAYGVDFEVPFLARTVKVDDYLFVGEIELFEGDMGTVGPGTGMVGVEDDFWGGAVCGAHAVGCGGHDG